MKKSGLIILLTLATLIIGCSGEFSDQNLPTQSLYDIDSNTTPYLQECWPADCIDPMSMSEQELYDCAMSYFDCIPYGTSFEGTHYYTVIGSNVPIDSVPPSGTLSKPGPGDGNADTKSEDCKITKTVGDYPSSRFTASCKVTCSLGFGGGSSGISIRVSFGVAKIDPLGNYTSMINIGAECAKYGHNSTIFNIGSTPCGPSDFCHDPFCPCN
jgi:hypothetical protein